MRVEFSKALEQVLETNPKALMVTGDLGFNAFEALQEKYGKRFLNAGVAEQNMMGAAAGMAMAGMNPWVYSIVPFVTFRCHEQVRNDVCLHDLPVRLVGNGGGYTYGIMGSTHHALEDLAVLKPLPNITLFFPAGGDQVEAAVKTMDRLAGPAYLRLAISAFNTSGVKPLSENPATLTRQYQKGARATVVCAGHATQIALAAQQKHGLSELPVDVFSVARYPFDLARDTELAGSIRSTGKVLFVEEHYAAGGMGESLKAAISEPVRFELMAPPYSKDQLYGSPGFHMKQAGMTPERLVERVKRLV